MSNESGAGDYGSAPLPICIGEFELIRKIGARYDAGTAFDIDEECRRGEAIGALKKLSEDQRTEFASSLCEKGLWVHLGGRRYEITERGQMAFDAMCPNSERIRSARDGFGGWVRHAKG